MILVNLTKLEVLSFPNVKCIISLVFFEYSPKGQLRNPAAVPTKTANPIFLQHNQKDNISFIDVNGKKSYIKLFTVYVKISYMIKIILMVLDDSPNDS